MPIPTVEYLKRRFHGVKADRAGGNQGGERGMRSWSWDRRSSRARRGTRCRDHIAEPEHQHSDHGKDHEGDKWVQE